MPTLAAASAAVNDSQVLAIAAIAVPVSEACERVGVRDRWTVDWVRQQLHQQGVDSVRVDPRLVQRMFAA